MYTLLYLKWRAKRAFCTAQGALLNVTWLPGWEGSFGENGYMRLDGWGPLLPTWNYRNIVNRLHSNTKQKNSKKYFCELIDILNGFSTDELG